MKAKQNIWHQEILLTMSWRNSVWKNTMIPCLLFLSAPHLQEEPFWMCFFRLWVPVMSHSRFPKGSCILTYWQTGRRTFRNHLCSTLTETVLAKQGSSAALADATRSAEAMWNCGTPPEDRLPAPWFASLCLRSKMWRLPAKAGTKPKPKPMPPAVPVSQYWIFLNRHLRKKSRSLARLGSSFGVSFAVGISLQKIKQFTKRQRRSH